LYNVLDAWFAASVWSVHSVGNIEQENGRVHFLRCKRCKQIRWRASGARNFGPTQGQWHVDMANPTLKFWMHGHKGWLGKSSFWSNCSNTWTISFRVKFQVARSSIDKLIETSQKACGRARGHVWLRAAASEFQYWQQNRGYAGAGLVDVKQEGDQRTRRPGDQRTRRPGDQSTNFIVLAVQARNDARKTSRTPIYFTLDHRRLHCMRVAGCRTVRVRIQLCGRVFDEFVNKARESLGQRLTIQVGGPARPRH
jgi:hypothetical protein